MKKIGIVIIVLLVVIMVTVGSVAYAFFNSSRAEFSLIIYSAEGASIGLDLEASSTTLRPANTSANVADYSSATGANGEQYAVYTIGYEASSDVEVKLFISNATYVYADETGKTAQQIEAIHLERDAYLTSVLQFCITVDENTDNWTISYMESNKANLAAYEFSDGDIGSIYCKVRFTVSQELVPPFYDGVKISFVVNSEVLEA